VRNLASFVVWAGVDVRLDTLLLPLNLEDLLELVPRLKTHSNRLAHQDLNRSVVQGTVVKLEMLL
jgi:hypothetical protein